MMLSQLSCKPESVQSPLFVAEAYVRALGDSDVARALRQQVEDSRRDLDAALGLNSPNVVDAEIQIFLENMQRIIGEALSVLGEDFDLATLPPDDPVVRPFHEAMGVFQPKAILAAAGYLLSMPGRYLAHREKAQILEMRFGKWIGRLLAWFRQPRIRSDSTNLAMEGRKFLRDKHGLIFMETDKGLNAPLRHSSVKHLGMFDLGLQGEMAEVFPSLEWDQYDVRRCWIEAILQHVDNEGSQDERLKAFYRGELDLNALDDLVVRLPEAEISRLKAIKPWRRRAIARFNLTEKSIKRLPVEEYVQPEGDDIRSWPRRFSELEVKIEQSVQFQQLLRQVLEYVQWMDNSIEEIEVTTHFMGLVAYPGQQANNAPEGPHQDGADLSVTALVVERENIQGGESIIYIRKPNGKLIPVYKATIQPGEFIIQADESSPDFGGEDYYHYVTPVTVVDPSRPSIRNIIGLDIKVKRRR